MSVSIAEDVHTFCGACDCGAVEFSFDIATSSRPYDVLDCNCSICWKKAILHLIVKREDFHIRTNTIADNMTTYTFGTHVAQHYFCRHCGCHPFYIPRSHPTCIDINVRCINDFDGFIRDCKITPFDGRDWDKNINNINSEYVSPS